MTNVKNTTREIIKNSRVVKFRQSLNLFSKNWTVVKIYDPNIRKFVPVDMDLTKKAITKKYGYCMLIYQVMRLFKNKRDIYERPMWKVTEVVKGRTRFSGNEYSTFEFTCTRCKHDISGVF